MYVLTVVGFNFFKALEFKRYAKKVVKIKTNNTSKTIVLGITIHSTLMSSLKPKGITKIDPNKKTIIITVTELYFLIKGLTNTKLSA